MSFFKPSKPRVTQISKFTPEQQGVQSDILGSLKTGLGGQGQSQALKYLMDLLGGASGSFGSMEAPARRAFSQQTVPSILERFRGAGAGSSSGLQQTLAGAGRQLEENLGAQRSQMQQGAAQSLLGNYLNQANLGLQSSFENVIEEGRPSGISQLLSALGPAVGGALGGVGMIGGQMLGSKLFGNHNDILSVLSQLFGE